MNCPYCGIEMEKGYVEQQRMMIPLEWYSAKQEVDFLWKTDRGGNEGIIFCLVAFATHLLGEVWYTKCNQNKTKGEYLYEQICL